MDVNVNREVNRLNVYTTLHYAHFQVLFGLSAVVARSLCGGYQAELFQTK